MDVRVPEIPMAGGEVLENRAHSQINNESFSFEDELLELYEALNPNTCTTPTPCVNPPPYPLQQLITASPSLFHDIYNHNPPPPPPVVVAEQQEQLQQVAALQRLQAQQEFQLRQQQWLHHQQQQQQLQLKHPQLQPQQNQRKATSSTSGIRKKRKREQMKTVYRVPAENILTVDKWAWRKYGQKPIKGSPFPRNYYRCSSSKGCTAKKQVERSITEPEVYVVTYSGDHFHPWPIHRNALAGVSRAHHRTCVYSIHRSDDHDQSAAPRHSAVSKTPSPQLPPPAPSDEEEGEGLLIPNRMYVDEDMLRGMEELGKWKIASGSDSGHGSGL